MNHIWNLVKIDGKWYHADITWDDPVRDMWGFISRNYLLVSDDKIKQDHPSWDDPALRSTGNKYDNFFWQVPNTKMIYRNAEWYAIRRNTTTGSYDLVAYTMPSGTERVVKGGISGSYPARLGEYGGKLIFNTRNELFYYDVEKDQTQSIQAFSESSPTSLLLEVKVVSLYNNTSIGGERILYRFTDDYGESYYKASMVSIGDTPVPNYCIVLFSSEGSYTVSTMVPQRVSVAKATALHKNTLKNKGFTFMGWKDSVGKSYANAAAIKPAAGTAGIVLTAQWKGDQLVMRLTSAKAYLNGGQIAVDPNNAKVYPFTLFGKTVVPVRFITNLGATLEYIDTASPITVSYNGKKVIFMLGNSTYYVIRPGSKVMKTFETAPRIVEGKTVLPFRAIAEALDFYVKYDEKTNMIMVSPGKITAAGQKEMISQGLKLKNNAKTVKSIQAKVASKTLRKGQTYEITADKINFIPADAGVKVLIYYTTNTMVATVSDKGKVTAKSAGTAVIYIISNNNKFTTVRITVG
jgi:hypothetical protein